MVVVHGNEAASDRIEFETGLASATLSLRQGELVINHDLTIGGDVDGDGRADVTVDANADGDEDAATRATGAEPDFTARRAFEVTGSAVFESLTITGGRTVATLEGGGGVPR